MIRMSRLLPFALALAAPLSMARAASPATPEQIGAAAGVEMSGGDVMGMDIARSADGLFYADVLINGRSVRFLVDTGANFVVLTAADAARVGVAMDAARPESRVATAAGSAPMAWGKIGHVEVAGREVRDLKVAVMRNGLAVSLLGQNMLSKLASVTIQGDRLRLR